MISFYGHPSVRRMGILGQYETAEVIQRVTALAAQYDALNGELDAIPALHLIVAVAHKAPKSDGSYLNRMSLERIAGYVEATREAGLLLFLDVQIGWSDPLAETQRLAEFLREPHVHLALDPEFATASLGVRPGLAIGRIDADTINAVQHYLAALAGEHRLPSKILVIHQFLQRMLVALERIEAVSQVDLVIDMDGFGRPHVKLKKYDWYALAEYAEYPGIKLFYDWDAPLMSPQRIAELDVPPRIVIYQ